MKIYFQIYLTFQKPYGTIQSESGETAHKNKLQ